MLNESEEFREIDVDKIKTIEDVKLVLKAMAFGVSELHPMYNEIKHLLKSEIWLDGVLL